MKNKKLLAVLCGLCLALFAAVPAFADSPTDKIRSYTITADVNEDATVNLVYHLEWEVLESDGIGPVEWVTVGVPGSHVEFVEALSQNIRSAGYVSDSGDYIRIDFTQAYYEGEVIEFEYLVCMDYMYEMNALQDGYTQYYFTPGWFDDIDVEELVVRWNNDKLTSWSGNCLVVDGYNTWQTSLAAGETFSVQLEYPNDAFAFSADKSYNDKSNWSGGWEDDDWDSDSSWSGGETAGFSIGGGAVIFWIVLFIIFRTIRKNYLSGANFSGAASSGSKEVVKRTKIVYYPTCPGCGAARKEGEKNCSYCGHSFIKSEEVIEEEHVKDADKDALKYKKNGEYAYSSDPNTFVRVNVVHVPIITRGGGSRGGGHGGTRSGGGRSGGCAHSSCACACASCACACACACAGGGRAGCTSKDFYDTQLKLEQLKRKK